MKSLMWKATGILAFALLALGMTATAHASHLNVRVVEPTPATVGQPSDLAAALTSADTGQPVAGVSVTFFAHASFGNVSDYMEIGRAVTDSQGIATIAFVPRESGVHDIRVDYTLVAGGEVEETAASVDVDGSADQMYVQTAGIQVPGLNSWLIIGMLSVVWGILLLVAVTVIRIAHAGEATSIRRLSPAAAMASSRNLESGSAGHPR